MLSPLQINFDQSVYVCRNVGTLQDVKYMFTLIWAISQQAKM